MLLSDRIPAAVSLLGVALTLALSCKLPVAPSGKAGLAPDEGYLLLYVHADRPVLSFDLEGAQLPGVPSGSYELLVVLEQGRHRLTRVSLSGSRFDLFDVQLWSFEIEAGKVNYLGDVAVSKQHGYVWLVARALSAMERFAEMRPALWARHEFVYAGLERDDFPARYRGALRDRALPAAPAEGVVSPEGGE